MDWLADQRTHHKDEALQFWGKLSAVGILTLAFGRVLVFAGVCFQLTAIAEQQPIWKTRKSSEEMSRGQ
jgi:hypothetical protein